jgi:hypothetical protein
MKLVYHLLLLHFARRRRFIIVVFVVAADAVLPSLLVRIYSVGA